MVKAKGRKTVWKAGQALPYKKQDARPTRYALDKNILDDLAWSFIDQRLLTAVALVG